MKTKNNFTIGVLSGIIATFFITILMSANSPETASQYEFYDLKDTRGLIFNKTTGEIKYETIREDAIQESVKISGSIRVSNGLDPLFGEPSPFKISDK